MDLKEEDILGADVGAHWYYRAKASLLRRSVGFAGTVVDIGAGSGFFARALLDARAATAVDCVDPGYPEETGPIQVGDGRIRFLRSLPDAADAYDSALLMDVLEHVDDELALLEPLRALLKPDGRLFITVPAFSWLWSGHDVFLEHRRRYTRSTLMHVVRAAGFEPLLCHYFYGLTFPLACAQRLITRRRDRTTARSALRRHHRLVNTVLSALCRAELPVARHNRVAGLSVVCIAANLARTARPILGPNERPAGSALRNHG